MERGPEAATYNLTYRQNISLHDFVKLLICTLTILTLCPGWAVMSQVHSFRLGYLSGQLGLLRVPVGLWILCSHSAGHTHTKDVKIVAAQEKVEKERKWKGNRKGRNERTKQGKRDFKETHADGFRLNFTEMHAIC